MDTIRPRRAAVLLLGAVLLLAAIPASAQPSKGVPGEPPAALAILDAVSAWLRTFWLPAGQNPAPSAGRAVRGEHARVAVEPGRGVGLGPCSGPTGDPERGGDLDPNG